MEMSKKAQELFPSYDKDTGLFEVVIRFVGNLTEILRDFPMVEGEALLGNYAILKGSGTDLRALSKQREILSMEGAKSIYRNQVEDGRENPLVGGLDAFCLRRSFLQEEDLRGAGVFMAYLDSGIDYRHPEFISPSGDSRIAFLWDQNRADGYYTKEQIRQALLLPKEEGESIVPQRDESGHGTHVAAIGSGNGGVAPESELLVVKLRQPVTGGSKTTDLMRGITRCVEFASQRQQPLVINISYGTNEGIHNDFGLLEQFLDDIRDYGKITVVVGTGNEGNGKSHTHISYQQLQQELKLPEDVVEVAWAVGAFQPGYSLQVWKRYGDGVSFFLQPAENVKAIEIVPQPGLRTYELYQMELLVYYGLPTPFLPYQQIYFVFLPKEDFLPQGILRLQLRYRGKPEGIYDIDPKESIDFYLPVQAVLSADTGFLFPTPDTTLTNPSAARSVLSVGAYDQQFDAPASFSGRGYSWNTRQVKPELVAPGVDILSASPGGGYTLRSGTSMATPFVSGVAALFMEWGIVRGRDPFLYGEKIKAYLIKGARSLPGVEVYPNPQVGWGALCMDNSVPN